MEDILRQVVEYAYRNSEFYQEKLKKNKRTLDELLEDWEKVPVISRDEIVQAKSSIVPFEYYGKIASGQVLSAHTSGSTGKCLEIYLSQAEMKKSLLPLWIFRSKYYGIEPKDSYCYFFTTRGLQEEPEMEYQKNGIGFSKINLTFTKIEKIYGQIQEYYPKWLHLQPSIAIILARYVYESGAEPLKGLRYIELTGEMFTEENRNFIKNAFGVPVANQYGCNELGSIAYECPCGCMHVMEHNVHVDIIKDGKRAKTNEAGSIVVTSKNHYIMPFIKYDTGDYGMFTGEKCSCGNHGAVLKLMKGRKNDLISFEDERVMGADEFVRIFQCISPHIDGKIYQYKIRQTGYYKFEVFIVTDEDKDKIEKLFFAFLQDAALKKAEYQFQYYEYLLPDEKSGKLRFFENAMVHEKGG